MHGPLDLRWDAGVYYTLGTSLAQGRGYRLLYEPGQIEADQYPPLLPAIVAAHQLVLGTDNPVVVGPALRFSWFAMSMLLVVILYKLAREYLAPGFACAAVLAWVLNLNGYFLSTLCFAELPFTLAAVLFAWAVRRIERAGHILAAAAAVVSYGFRSVGIAVLLTWIVDGAVHGHWRRALARAAVTAGLVLAWSGWIAHVEGSPSYGNPAYSYQRATYLFYNVSYSRNMAYKDPFRPESGNLSMADRARRLVVNGARMPYELGLSLIGRVPVWQDLLSTESGIVVWVARLIGIATGLGIVAGFVVLWLGGEKLLSVYVVLTLAAVSLSPWASQNWRYLAPLTPFTLVALFASFQRAGERWPRVAGLASAAFLCLTACSIIGSVHAYGYSVRAEFRGSQTSWRT
jgi:hypothetical protein